MGTYRPEVHEAGEGDDPEVHGVDNVTTIELGEGLALDVWVSARRINRDLTKRPSANQLFKVAATLGTMLSASAEMAIWYPSGPGGIRSLIPENVR